MTNTESNTSRFPVDPEFGARISDARIERGYSLGRLADAVGISVTDLMDIEQGKKPIDSAHILRMLAEELHISKDELLKLATKRTYEEMYEDYKLYKEEIDKILGDESDEDSDDFFFQVAMIAHMSEEELWETIAQELINHELHGTWLGEDESWWEDYYESMLEDFDDDDEDFDDENFEF